MNYKCLRYHLLSQYTAAVHSLLVGALTKLEFTHVGYLGTARFGELLNIDSPHLVIEKEDLVIDD